MHRDHTRRMMARGLFKMFMIILTKSASIIKNHNKSVLSIKVNVTDLPVRRHYQKKSDQQFPLQILG
jgi:hypothetical protein